MSEQSELFNNEYHQGYQNKCREVEFLKFKLEQLKKQEEHAFKMAFAYLNAYNDLKAKLFEVKELNMSMLEDIYCSNCKLVYKQLKTILKTINFDKDLKI